MRGTGGQEIGALVAGAQQRFPGFAFRLLGPAGRARRLRALSLGAWPGQARRRPSKAADVVKLRGERIAEVIGFLDKVPQS